jgi:hypothetical protein
MWSKDVPTEPGHYWIKLNNGWQEIILGQRSTLNPKKLVFYMFNAESGITGEQLLKERSRFWSEPIPTPEVQPADLLESHEQSDWD